MVLIYTTPPIFMVWSALFNIHCSPCAEMCCNICHTGGADKSLAHPGRKKANVSVRMMWISFGTLPYRKKTLWQLVSQCCWNRACPWHASELVSFLVGLRTYQHPGITQTLKHMHVMFFMPLKGANRLWICVRQRYEAVTALISAAGCEILCRGDPLTGMSMWCLLQCPASTPSPTAIAKSFKQTWHPSQYVAFIFIFLALQTSTTITSYLQVNQNCGKRCGTS